MDVKDVKMDIKKKMRSIVVPIFIILVVLILAASSCTVINSGTVGIVSVMGAVQDQVFTPGLNFKIPLISTVAKINVQTQKVEVDSTAASRDLQTISSTVAVNYHIDTDSAVRLYKTIGRSYEYTIIAPAIQECVKSVTAQYSAEQLITKRQEVSVGIKEELISKVNVYGIVIDDFNITNLDFSAEFNAAIEAKQTAQQQALKAEQDLTRIKIEAQQQVEQAKAEAEAIKATAEAEAYAIKAIQEQLLQSPEYLEYQKIEKWDGVLPKVQGDAGTIIDLREDD